MNLINHTPFVAEWITQNDSTAHENIVIVVKATYHITGSNEPLEPAQVQQPICQADTASGEPGMSAPLLDSDWCMHKPKIDVLLLGSAYAPDGKPVARVPVCMNAGSINKRFVVTGVRHWERHWTGMILTDPTPFVSQPIRYDHAFGGMRVCKREKMPLLVYDANPIGQGFDPEDTFGDRTLAPQTEEISHPIKSRDTAYRPMAFSPIGRWWKARSIWAGTYDDRWRAERFPFLPEDFDARYFQSAPPDQQLDEISSGMPIELINLAPPNISNKGRLRIELPNLQLPMVLRSRRGAFELKPRVDTLILQPDEAQLCIVWRAVHRIEHGISDFIHVEIGKRPKGQTVKVSLEQLIGELPSRQRADRFLQDGDAI